jgi:hypothetical protein
MMPKPTLVPVAAIGRELQVPAREVLQWIELETVGDARKHKLRSLHRCYHFFVRGHVVFDFFRR